jgi:hypothetical protein
MRNIVSLYNAEYYYNRYNQTDYAGAKRNILRYDEPSVFSYAPIGDPFYVGYSVTRLEYHALRNAIIGSRVLSPSFVYDDYLTARLKVITFPSKVTCDGLVPGTVDLKWFQNGELLAEATDHVKNGELRQVLPAASDKVIGRVLYGEGVIILFDTDDLGGDDEKFYSDVWSPVGPIYDTSDVDPSWVGFFCPCNPVNEKLCAKSVFEIHFESNNKIFNKVFYADLENLNCSTNPTYFPEGGGVQFTKNEVFELEGTSGVEPYVAVRKIGVYDSNRKLIGFVELAQPLFFNKTKNFSIRVSIDF